MSEYHLVRSGHTCVKREREVGLRTSNSARKTTVIERESGHFLPCLIPLKRAVRYRVSRERAKRQSMSKVYNSIRGRARIGKAKKGSKIAGSGHLDCCLCIIQYHTVKMGLCSFLFLAELRLVLDFFKKSRADLARNVTSVRHDADVTQVFHARTDEVSAREGQDVFVTSMVAAVVCPVYLGYAAKKPVRSVRHGPDAAERALRADR
mmetsp:Transcript_43495/g.113214  ORF Transcript_43495/g.113214 Transcript_43495/m.113214 type:complete len:207 (+) Transcript_43495:1971-2591(+)